MNDERKVVGHDPQTGEPIYEAINFNTVTNQSAPESIDNSQVEESDKIKFNEPEQSQVEPTAEEVEPSVSEPTNVVVEKEPIQTVELQPSVDSTTEKVEPSVSEPTNVVVEKEPTQTVESQPIVASAAKKDDKNNKFLIFIIVALVIIAIALSVAIVFIANS